MKKLILQGLTCAVGEVAYIAVVATTIMTLGKRFPTDPPGIFAPVLFLALLVLSVSVSGALVLGRPVLLYLEGKKRDAVKLFLITLSWLFLIILILLAIIILMYK